jgi:hypothetical protein
MTALILGRCRGAGDEVKTSASTPGQAANVAELEPEPEPEPTKEPIPVELLSATPRQLCARLGDIKTIPTFEPTPTDPIYEALIANGKDVIPCLVEKISDARIVADPRYSVPHWQFYAVGDSAVFILIDILRDNDTEREKLLIEMLPPKPRAEWESNGVYAYFNYVSEPKNRKQLQQWWKNWLKDNNK